MQSSVSNKPIIWDIVVRLCHWLLVLCFVINYFIVEPGRLVHEIAGYTAVGVLVVRLIWGLKQPASSLASYRHIYLRPTDFKAHWTHLKARQLPHNAGHNPLGWLMIFLVWALMLGLGITGFIMEEIDAFFGDPTIEWAHSIMADTLYIAALVHVAGILVTQWWGRIPLIKAMIRGTR